MHAKGERILLSLTLQQRRKTLKLESLCAAEPHTQTEFLAVFINSSRVVYTIEIDIWELDEMCIVR